MGHIYTIHVIPHKVHLHVGNKICYFTDKRDALRVSKFASKYVDGSDGMPKLQEYEDCGDKTYHVFEKNTTVHTHNEEDFKHQLMLRNLGYHECVIFGDHIVCVDSHINTTN